MEVKTLNKEFVLKTALKIGLSDLNNLDVEVITETRSARTALNTENLCYILESDYLSKVFLCKCSEGQLKFDINSLDNTLNIEMSFNDKIIEENLAIILCSFLERDVVFNRDNTKVYDKEDFRSEELIQKCLNYCASEPENDIKGDKTKGDETECKE